MRLLEPPRFILGSGSQSRRALLEASGARFDVIAPNIDEKSLGDRELDAPGDLVQCLALAKADALLAKLTDPPIVEGKGERVAGTVVLTADQVVTYDGRVREKPTSEAEARAFIESYSG